MSNLQVPGEQGEGKVRAVSNPLPGLASLNFHNNRGDAQQDYETAQASRANATLDEIEQRGIVPDVNLVERELLVSLVISRATHRQRYTGAVGINHYHQCRTA